MAEDKTQKEIEQERKDIKENLSSLNDVINKFSKKNQEGFDRVLEASKKIEIEKKETSDLAKDVLSRMQSIAKESRTASAGDRKKSIKEIESLERSITLEKDKSTKEAITEQLKVLKKTTKDNTKFLDRTKDFVVNNLGSIGGVIAGVLADSPILAVGADFLIRKAQDKFKEKEELRISERDRAESQRDILLEKESDLKDELGTVPQEQEVDLTETAKIEASGEDQDNIMEGNENRNTILEEISERLNDLLGVVRPITEDSEERRREDAVFREKLLKKNKGDTSIEKVNEEGDSLFASILAGVSGGIGGLLAGLGATILGFMKGLGKLFLKGLSKIFLPVLIIGSLFSGIMEAIDVFKKTGSIKEAMIGFLGGILDFITFGLIDTDTLKKVGKFLIDGVTRLLTSISESIMAPFIAIKKALGKMLLFVIDKIPGAATLLPEGLIDSIEQLADQKITGEPLDPIIKNQPKGKQLRSVREETERIKNEQIEQKDSSSSNIISSVDNSTNVSNTPIMIRPSANNWEAPLPS